MPEPVSEQTISVEINGEVYEQEARSEGLPDYQIRELTVDGRLVRAGERAEYFPVRSIEPRERNERALGFDLASDNASERAIRSARAIMGR